VLNRVSQGYLRRIGREVVGSGVEEFFQEGAQYFLQKAGVEGAEFRWTDTTLLEAFNAAMAGMVGGGVVGGGMAARQQIVLERISRELRDAGQTVQNMDELANVTQDLQLAQRSPTKFQQLAERLGLSRVPVFYQAEDLNTYFQSQNKDPVTEVVKLGGTAEDFEAALASGGRISVTAEGLARAGLRGTDGDFLREQGSFTPAGSTPAEAQAINQTYNEIQQQIQEQSRMAEMAPERRQVYDAIYAQLRSAGRSQREAEANAALSTAFFETMAQRYGEDSGLDLYRRFGFRVEGPRQMARAEAAAEAAQMEIPDETVALINDAITQAQAGGPVTLPVTPEVTLALQTLGVPVDETGTISAEDAQRLISALQALEDAVAPAAAGPTFMQTATIRRGEEALEVPTEGRAPSTREVAAALEGRQREQFGTIERGDYSDEAADRISDWAVEEVMFEVEQARANPERSAVGWYSEKFQRALDVFGGAFPELIGDLDMNLPGVAALGSQQAARDFFTALIAITSDGAKVADNFRFASRVMEQFRRDGRIDPNITFGGERNKSMQINLRNIQEALDTLGPDQMAEQLLKKDTISNLKRLAKEQGKSFSTAYKANMELPYAALVFGPKLGAFYANLMGDTGYLTMDRWWSRTFNRYRGTLLAAPTEAGMDRVKDLIIADRRLNVTADQMSDDEALVYAADYVASYKAKDYKNGTELERAANTVYKAAFDQLEDQPFNASDREFMVNTTLRMQDKLADRGVDLTVADIQAVLWYYEKRLYAELGARATADVSYEEIARQIIEGRADPAGADGADGAELSLNAVGDESGAREPAADFAEQDAEDRTLFQRGRGTGGYSSGGLAPLEGAPTVVGAAGPDAELVAVAEQYAAANGIDLRRQAEFVEVDPERATRIAEAYEQMVHAPQDPEVQAAYADLIQQTIAQYQALIDAGYTFTFFDSETDPYAGNPWNAMRDLRANKTMAVYGTYDGYGTEGLTAELIADNPMLQDTGLVWLDQNGVERPVTANDLFRAVHDAFGHGIEGAGFRARGEENAWQAHVRLFTGPAIGVLTSETRGQNSWLNYGPFGEQNRTASVDDTVFAPQKAGIMPEFTWTEGRAADEAVTPQVLEQRPEGTEPRGSITFPGGGLDSAQSVIRLFERADRSTFAHEAGHFFLEAFKQLATDPQAPQGMIDDLRTINEYLGRDPEDTSEYTVDQQETWARSFEAYIMEGKAPSIALRSAFERFKAWLTRIYRQAVNLQVELSPEIRDVMDRMLATEEEIALVKAEQEISPLFLERPTGMDEADYDRYRKTATEADDEASQRLMNKLMARIRLQRTKTYNAERKALMATVEEELRQTRTYQTVDRLQTGETRLNRQQIVDQFGEEALRDMNREKLGGKRAVYTPGGADLAVVAELMGYDSDVQMIEELRGAQKFSIAVELEVNKRLDQKYGDLLTDGSIKDAARAAMHSDKRGQLLTAEANQLRAQIEAAGGPTPPNLSREAIKQQARDMIQDMSVRQAASPNAFLRAERKAAGEAQRAFSRVARAPSGRLETTGAQDLIAAHAAKRRQLLNHYLYVEARKAEELVAKMRKQSTRLQKKSTREAVASPYIDEIYALLEQYDFRQLSPGQVAKQQNLAAFVAAMEAADRAGELSIDDRLIQRAQRTHFSTLTVDELQGLKDTLDNLEHLGRTKMKLLDARNERNYAEVQQSVLRSLEQHLPDQPVGLVERAGDARKRAGRIALNTVLTADAIINRLDGSVQGVGDVWRAIKEPISLGLSRVQVRKKQAAEDFVELFKKHYTDKERRDLNAKLLSVPEIGQSLPKQAILAIALNTGNRDNFERLTNPDNAHSIPRDQVQAVLARHMDERDWRFVQDIWDYLNSYWPEISAQERALTGVNPRKVDSQPQITPHAFVKGGYYPIRYDPRLSGAVQDYDHNQMMENLKGGRFAKAQTRNGHTKERVSSTGQPLRLDLGIAIAHVNDVIYDLELRQPVQNSWRLLNDPQIDATFKRKGASEDAEALKLWVQDTANGDRWAGGGLSAAYRHLRGGLSIAKMGFSITTLVQQPTGLLQSAVVVGKGPLSKALWKYKNNPMRNAAAVRAMSPFMEERQQTFQRDLNVLTESMAEDPTFSRYNTFKQVMSAAAFYLIQKTQFYVVDVPTWMAAYDTELRRNGGNSDAAASVADQLVARSQGSGMLSDRTAFERGTLGKDQRNVELARLMTTFGSYMIAKFSVATQRVRGTDLKNPAEFVSLLVDLLMLYTIESAIAIFLTGNWPDFEEEEEDPLLFLTKETAFAIMSGLPLAREAASTLDGFGGGGTLATAIEETSGLLTGAYRMGEIALGLEEEDRARAALKDVLGGMGVLFQLPTIQLQRTLDGMFDDDMQFRDDFTAMDLLLGRRPE
jgi:hypothetical protein